MSIFIKGIDIPKCCDECVLKYDIKCKCYIGYHHQDTSRASKCPIIVEPNDMSLSREKQNNLYKDLCQYKSILDQTVNNLDITQGDFLYGKWLAYTDCLTMINGIINKYKNAGTGSEAEC